MKKYKLIKKLPFKESPEVGYISTPCCMKENKENGLHYWSHYWNHNWFNPKDYPEYWEEVIEKNYEILSFSYRDWEGEFAKLKSNGAYSLSTLGSDMEWSLECILSKGISVESGHIKIHSVKRLSDGEVFTVGDKVSHYAEYKKGEFSTKNYTLEKIYFIEENRLAFYVGTGLNLGIKNISKAKQPLFMTEDGVDLFLNDAYFWVADDSYVFGKNKWEVVSNNNCKISKEDPNFAKGVHVFSTKKAAQYFITNNLKKKEKLFSLKDLKKHYHDANPNVGKLNHATQRFFKHLEDVADRLF